MKSLNTFITDSPKSTTQASITGFWEKCYVFSIDLSKMNNYVNVEYLAFSKDGTGEYGYQDASGSPGMLQWFTYKIEYNKVILTTDNDNYEFFIEGEHLLHLHDDSFNYAEGFVRKPVVGQK